MGHNQHQKPWMPRNPPEDFRFSSDNASEYSPDDWPREPDAYRPTMHFRQRFHDYNRALDGSHINEAITEGTKIPAMHTCGAFYTTRPGVVYYVVVGWDRTSDPASNDRVVVTGWPWVYDREAAIESGRYSTRVLNRIQQLNGTLFNEHTVDDDWLGYYEEGLHAEF